MLLRAFLDSDRRRLAPIKQGGAQELLVPLDWPASQSFLQATLSNTLVEAIKKLRDFS